MKLKSNSKHKIDKTQFAATSILRGKINFNQIADMAKNPLTIDPAKIAKAMTDAALKVRK